MTIMDVVTVVSAVLTIELIAYGLYRKYHAPKAKAESFPLTPKLEKIIAGILALCLVIVLGFKLGEVPAGIHVDEAGMAYDALALAEHGTDRFGYHNPVYLINFGGGQNALYTYLASLVVRIFGFSIFAIRIPAVIMALAAAAAFYFLMRRAKGPFTALVSLALFIVLPFSVMHSRWGLESYLFFPMSIMSITALWLAFKERKIWQFVLAGVGFGITLYTYAVSYLILPVFLAIILIYALVTKRISWWELFSFALPLGILALPLILMLAINQGIIGEISTGFFSIPKMWFYRGGEFSLGHIIQNLNIFEIIFSHDFLSYNANAKYGTMFYFSVPLVILGFGLAVRHTYLWTRQDWQTRKFASGFSLDAIMVVFCLVNFACAMILDGPNINRINAIYVPLFYFLAIAIVWLYRRWRWSLAVFAVLYFISFGLFAKWYYFTYPTVYHDQDFFVSLDDFDQALDFAKTRTDNEIKIITGNMNFQPYIYTVLADEIDAVDFQDQKTVQDLQTTKVGRYTFSSVPEKFNSNAVYLFMRADLVPHNTVLDQMTSQRFGEMVVYYGNKEKSRRE